MAGLWPPIFFCHRYKTTVSDENKLSSGGVCHKLKARTFRNVRSEGGGKNRHWSKLMVSLTVKIPFFTISLF